MSQWVEKQVDKILDVPHRDCVFTIPEEFRNYFYWNKESLKDLQDMVHEVIAEYANGVNTKSRKEYIKKKKHKKGGELWQVGMIGVVHMFGRNLGFNPHVHALIPEIKMKGQEIKEMAYLEYEYLRKVWQYKLIKYMISKKPDQKPEYLKMFKKYADGFYIHAIDEGLSGKIDMIITKSVSRFARNTLDCLQYIRLLKENNIAVFFEKENINTLDAKGEVLLVIISSLAQEESYALSHNTRWGIVHRFQSGKVVVNAKRFLGYDKDENGELIIVHEQAEIVKRIYKEFLEGKSARQIAKGLTNDKIKNGAGNIKWHESNIIQILKNEKYKGDALLQKTYTTDFLTKKRVKNKGYRSKLLCSQQSRAYYFKRGLCSSASRI